MFIKFGSFIIFYVKSRLCAYINVGVLRKSENIAKLTSIQICTMWESFVFKIEEWSLFLIKL